jgi:hypothetical protein
MWLLRGRRRLAVVSRCDQWPCKGGLLVRLRVWMMTALMLLMLLGRRRSGWWRLGDGRWRWEFRVRSMRVCEEGWRWVCAQVRDWCGWCCGGRG